MPVDVDMAVFTSERATGHRNRAIAHLMRNFDIIDERIEEALDLYFKQCSILVTCRDLAMMAATLANGGVNPLTGERAVAVEYVRDILSVMYTCGMYDFAGEWAYSVGLPAKSGVGGGIIAVLPGQAGIGVFSPPLDARGNSVRGIRVCEELLAALRRCTSSTVTRRTAAWPRRSARTAGRTSVAMSAGPEPRDLPSLSARAATASASRRSSSAFEALVKAVIPIGVALLGARDFHALLETILLEAKTLCHADGGTLYLRTDDDQLRFVILRNDSLGIALGGSGGAAIPYPPLPLYDPASGAPNERNVATYAALRGESVNIADAYAADGFEFSGTHRLRPPHRLPLDLVPHRSAEERAAARHRRAAAAQRARSGERRGGAVRSRAGAGGRVAVERWPPPRSRSTRARIACGRRSASCTSRSTRPSAPARSPRSPTPTTSRRCSKKARQLRERLLSRGARVPWCRRSSPSTRFAAAPASRT